MKPRQKVALAAPCLARPVVVGRTLREVVTAQGESWSTILTVNRYEDAFGGRPAWHGSVALWACDADGVPVSMQRRQREGALVVARRLVEGVGLEPEAVDALERLVHVRRALTDAELARLPAGWVGAAPVPPAGGGGHLGAHRFGMLRAQPTARGSSALFSLVLLAAASNAHRGAGSP